LRATPKPVQALRQCLGAAALRRPGAQALRQRPAAAALRHAHPGPAAARVAALELLQQQLAHTRRLVHLAEARHEGRRLTQRALEGVELRGDLAAQQVETRQAQAQQMATQRAAHPGVERATRQIELQTDVHGQAAQALQVLDHLGPVGRRNAAGQRLHAAGQHQVDGRAVHAGVQADVVDADAQAAAHARARPRVGPGAGVGRQRRCGIGSGVVRSHAALRLARHRVGELRLVALAAPVNCHHPTPMSAPTPQPQRIARLRAPGAG
jgi:hypothetical protein